MIPLSLPVAPPYQRSLQQLRYYSEGRNQAGQDRLVRLRPAMMAAYQVYISASGNPEHYPADRHPRSPSGQNNDTDGDFLYACYRSGHGPDRLIIESATKANLGYCPYCALKFPKKPHHKAADKDHYLPRSRFPELSILAVNLVVACDGCNDAKEAKYLSPNGEKLFIHPYFDGFLHKPFLQASFSIVDGTPQVEFYVDASKLTKCEAALVQRHAEELDVFSRMSWAVQDMLCSFVHGARIRAEELAETRHVLRVIGEQELMRGPNDPLGVALTTLANSDELKRLLVAQ